MIAFISFSAYLLLSSLVTFILYVTDKNKAKKGKWRLKESNLLLSSFVKGKIHSPRKTALLVALAVAVTDYQ